MDGEDEIINHTAISNLHKIERINEVEEKKRKEEEKKEEKKEALNVTKEEIKEIMKEDIKERKLVEEMKEGMKEEVKKEIEGVKSILENEKDSKNKEVEDEKNALNNDEDKRMNEGKEEKKEGVKNEVNKEEMKKEEKKKELKNEEKEMKKELIKEEANSEDKKNEELKNEVKKEEINDEVKKRVMIGGRGMNFGKKNEDKEENIKKEDLKKNEDKEEEDKDYSDEILTETALEEKINKGNNFTSFCDGENMAYNVSYPGDAHTSQYILKGKKFDCSLLSQLKRLNLTDRWHSGVDDGFNNGNAKRPRISDPRNMTGTPFVLAANVKFYPSLRAIIDGIRRYFIRNVQIIVYDLGGLNDINVSRLFKFKTTYMYVYK
uniref:Uncharacterized protein n=1 Tax=Meloidogyne hapla TaxID=6305 RepID=A0A1I8BRY8_MELHA